MTLFKIPTRNNKNSDRDIAKKSKSMTKAPTAIRGGGLLSQIEQIKRVVDSTLGKYSNDYLIITDENELMRYFQNCIESLREIAIDTETTGLDPLLDKIVGLCVYIPGCKGAYIPINHVSYVTGTRVDNQLTEEVVGRCLQRVVDASVPILMFNAKFDIRVIRNTLGVKNIYCTWDCYLASRLMNENEPHKGLKALHQKYVLEDKEDEFKFEALFKGVTADKIPINSFYLYAAHDAVITYELYEFQKQYLYYDPACAPEDRNGMNGVAWVFHNIEMPCVDVVCDMEDVGIELDMEYAGELSKRYNDQLQAKYDAVMEIVATYSSKIEMYRISHENAKIDNPMNIASPTQVAIFLYDIMGLEPIDKKSPRGTGEPILSKIVAGDGYDKGVQKLCQAILDYRAVQKLISTYIDKLPDSVNPNDGRIHCSFNQYGADTGRFSSSDPNLQNIPSHNKEIRKMFVATNEEKLVSTDTQQFVVDRWCEVECADEWKYADKIIVGDELLLDDGSCVNVCGVTVAHDKVVIDFT